MTDTLNDRTEMAEDLLEILPRLLHALRRDRARLAGDDPLTEALSERRGQLRLLYVLREQGRMTTQELAQRLEVAPPTVSTMVRALTEHDFVARERDEADQRQVWISLSERGRRAVAEERRRMRTVVLARFERLDPADQDAVVRAIPAFERMLATHPRPCDREDT